MDLLNYFDGDKLANKDELTLAVLFSLATENFHKALKVKSLSDCDFNIPSVVQEFNSCINVEKLEKLIDKYGLVGRNMYGTIIFELGGQVNV